MTVIHVLNIFVLSILKLTQTLSKIIHTGLRIDREKLAKTMFAEKLIERRLILSKKNMIRFCHKDVINNLPTKVLI